MDITSASRLILYVLSVTGPFICAAAIAFIGWLAVTARGRARLRLARRGLTDTGHGRLRRQLAGALLPALAITSLSVAFSIEAEIREGPNRMIEGMTSLLPAGKSDAVWVLEAGTDHLMNVSNLPDDLFVDVPGVVAVPFTAELASIEGESGRVTTGLVLGTPGIDGIGLAETSCAEAALACGLAPGEVMVDATDGYSLGGRLLIRGADYTVADYFDSPMSLLNRSVVFARPESDQQGSVYGYVAVGDLGSIELAAAVADAQVLRQVELEERNSRFWAGNGTPILMMLISLVTVFSAAVVYGTRRAEQEATKPVRWTLWAIGSTRGEAMQIQAARAITAIAVALPAAVLAAILLVAFLDSSMIGLQAEVGPRQWVAATGLVLLGSLVPTVGYRN